MICPDNSKAHSALTSVKVSFRRRALRADDVFGCWLSARDIDEKHPS